jgi:DNA-binding NtrC family response regulator
MVDALVVTFRVLRLSARRPDLAALATRKIIELARAGEREAERLKRAALNALPH